MLELPQGASLLPHHPLEAVGREELKSKDLCRILYVWWICLHTSRDTTHQLLAKISMMGSNLTAIYTAHDLGDVCEITVHCSVPIVICGSGRLY